MKKMHSLLLLGLLGSLAACKPGPVHVGSFYGNNPNNSVPVSVAVSKQSKLALDPQSQQQADAAMQTALQTGQAASWQSATAHGTVQLGRGYRQGNRICRPFTNTVVANGRTEVLKNVACQTKKGWAVSR